MGGGHCRMHTSLCVSLLWLAAVWISQCETRLLCFWPVMRKMNLTVIIAIPRTEPEPILPMSWATSLLECKWGSLCVISLVAKRFSPADGVPLGDLNPSPRKAHVIVLYGELPGKRSHVSLFNVVQKVFVFVWVPEMNLNYVQIPGGFLAGHLLLGVVWYVDIIRASPC